MFSHHVAKEPESNTTRLFRPVLQVAAPEAKFTASDYIVLMRRWCVCVTENSERLVLYSVIAVCLGLIAVLLAVIFYLVCCRTRSRRSHRVLRSSTTNSDEKFSSRNLLSSSSTQTSPENQFLLSPDSPDKTWVRSPTPAVGSPNRASPHLLADPSSSPSTLRSLPMRVHSGPSTVGDDLIWKTLERQRPRSPNAGLYTNPYRHDTFRTIDSRSSKSPRK